MWQRVTVWWRQHPRLAWIIACCLLLFLVFEIGIRCVQPNGVRVTDVSTSGATLSAYQSTDPRVARRIKNGLETGASTFSLNALLQENHCSQILTFQPNTSTYTFTYDGIPIESFIGEAGTSCGYYTESAGGIPNLLILYGNDPGPIWDRWQ